MAWFGSVRFRGHWRRTLNRTAPSVRRTRRTAELNLSNRFDEFGLVRFVVRTGSNRLGFSQLWNTPLDA